MGSEGSAVLKEDSLYIATEIGIWNNINECIPPPDTYVSSMSIKVLTAVWTLMGWSYEMASYDYKNGFFHRRDGLSYNVSYWQIISGPK